MIFLKVQSCHATPGGAIRQYCHPAGQAFSRQKRRQICRILPRQRTWRDYIIPNGLPNAKYFLGL
jgi:hypothetical protein